MFGVSLLFIGNGFGYLIPPMIVSGPTNQGSINSNVTNQSSTQWSDEDYDEVRSQIMFLHFKW